MYKLKVRVYALQKQAFFLSVIIAIFLDALISLVPSIVGISVFVKASLLIIFGYFSVKFLKQLVSYKQAPIMLLLFFCFLSLFYSLYSSYPLDSILRTIKQFYAVLLTISFYYLLIHGHLSKILIKKMLIIFLTVTIPTSLYLTLFPQIEHIAQAAGAYGLLWAIFCAVLVVDKKDKLLNIMIVISVLVLFMIVKRGAILCLLSSFVFWFYLYNTKNITAKKLLTTFSLIFGLAALVGIFIFLRGDLLQERLSDTSGSGRDLLYLLLITDYFNSSIFEMFFGHGALAVQVFSGEMLSVREGAKYGIQAHSDWLTLLYDFGLLGFFTFCSFHICILKQIRKIKSYNYPLYCKYAAIYISLFFMSFFSEVLYTTSLVWLSFFIALVGFTSINRRGL